MLVVFGRFDTVLAPSIVNLSNEGARRACGKVQPLRLSRDFSFSLLPSFYLSMQPSFYLSDNVERGLPPSLHPTPAGDDGLAHSLTLSFATLLQGTFHATVQAVMEMHKILCCWLG